MNAAQLYPYPSGWYAVGFSKELKPGEIKAISFMDKELVLYRTESGQAVVSDAFCPHLGAHFAKGGKIIGEEIQCPFHGFRFDCSGTCTATGYETKAPPKAKLKQWPTDEKNGVITVYHHTEGAEPSWHIPDMDTTAWSELATAEYELQSHPQETTENIVDVGHFTWVHGYDGVTVNSETEANDHIMTVEYGFDRAGRELGRSGKIRVNFKANAHGLVYSFVETDIPKLGIKTLNFVLPTPVGNGKVKLHLGMVITEMQSASKLHPLAAIVPRTPLSKLILKAAFKGYCKDVLADFDIWNNKVHIPQPPIAKGDGPIPLFRKWTKQFYTEQYIN